MSNHPTAHIGAAADILEMLSAGPMTTRELSAALAEEGIRGRRLHNAVQWLEKSGRIFKEGEGHAAWRLLPPPERTLQQRTRMPAAVRHLATLPHPQGLPMLELGEGERRDCAGYEGCLDRYLDRFKRLSNYPARCPAKCASFAAPARSVDEYASQRRWMGGGE